MESSLGRDKQVVRKVVREDVEVDEKGFLRQIPTVLKWWLLSR
jgi:hypothetical protein